MEELSYSDLKLLGQQAGISLNMCKKQLLLPYPRSRGLGRGKGKRNFYPPETREILELLGFLRRIGFHDPRWLRLWLVLLQTYRSLDPMRDQGLREEVRKDLKEAIEKIRKAKGSFWSAIRKLDPDSRKAFWGFFTALYSRRGEKFLSTPPQVEQILNNLKEIGFRLPPEDQVADYFPFLQKVIERYQEKGFFPSAERIIDALVSAERTGEQQAAIMILVASRWPFLNSNDRKRLWEILPQEDRRRLEGEWRYPFLGIIGAFYLMKEIKVFEKTLRVVRWRALIIVLLIFLSHVFLELLTLFREGQP